MFTQPQALLRLLIVTALLVAGATACKSPPPGKSNFARILASDQTPLDRYVAAPDTNFAFQLVKRIPGQGFTADVLELTSQAWLTTNEVDRPLWKHWLIVTRPDEVTSSKSLMFITGGKNGGSPPEKPDANLARIALATRSVVAELKMVPNQTLRFAGDSEDRVEDSLIAYTWDKFLRTGDERWPARLPMTKSAVRAMDAVTAYCASSQGGGLRIDQFVVSGGSKRGWTTWTTAAVDKRVIAIIPAVIDVLNVEPSMLHHYAAYGFWAPAIEDYTRFRIMDWNGTEQNRALMKIEDPFEYRQRFTMPKLILNASGDQFFLPDSSQFYFNDLPGIKYLRYVPNADHSLKGSDAYETVLAFYDSILNSRPLPEFSWKKSADGRLEVKTTTSPSKLVLWQAINPDARDFRIETLGPKWTSTTLEPSADGRYTVTVPAPARGWTAFFVELTFPTPVQVPLKFTTEVVVVPDRLPYKFVPSPPPIKRPN